jgi:hypothetical protein
MGDGKQAAQVKIRDEVAMRQTEVLIREIEGLLRTREIELAELATTSVTGEERTKLRAQIQRCLACLKALDQQLAEPGSEA